MEQDLDFNAIVREEMQKIMKETEKPAAEQNLQTEQPRPIKVNIEGQEYTFNNEQELSNSLVEFRKQALAEIERAKQPVPAATGAGAKGDDAPNIDMDRFATLMKDGKVVEAFDYVDSVRYKTPNPSQMILERLKKTEQIEQLMIVDAFRQTHPEFPLQDQQATQFLEQVRSQIGAPFNAQGLEAAYYTAVNKYPQYREYLDSKKPQAPPTVPSARPNNPYLTAPPSINRTSISSTDSNNQGYRDSDIDNMSADQLRTLIEQVAARG